MAVTVVPPTPFTIAALKVELLTDPASVGYAPFIITGDDNSLADLLNLVRTGPTYQVYSDPASPSRIFAAIDATDFSILTTTDLSRLQVILTTPLIDLSASNIKTMVTGVFPLGPTTQQNIAALVTRNGSRAEVLWGPHTVVTPNQVFLARTS